MLRLAYSWSSFADLEGPEVSRQASRSGDLKTTDGGNCRLGTFSYLKHAIRWRHWQGAAPAKL